MKMLPKKNWHLEWNDIPTYRHGMYTEKIQRNDLNIKRLQEQLAKELQDREENIKQADYYAKQKTNS